MSRWGGPSIVVDVEGCVCVTEDNWVVTCEVAESGMSAAASAAGGSSGGEKDTAVIWCWAAENTVEAVFHVEEYGTKSVTELSYLTPRVDCVAALISD